MNEQNAKAATDAAKAEGGGVVIGVTCDHSDDKSTEALFERVLKEKGRIDVLVNNATNTGGSPNLKGGGRDLKFWEQDAAFYDSLMNVGCRSHFLCSVLASKDMIARKQGGVIVNISSFGAVTPYSG